MAIHFILMVVFTIVCHTFAAYISLTWQPTVTHKEVVQQPPPEKRKRRPVEAQPAIHAYKRAEGTSYICDC